MDGCDTFETFFSVKAGVDLIAEIIDAPIDTALDEGGTVRFVDTFDGKIRFTLYSHENNPEWTHVLSSDPDDMESLGTFISELGIPADRIGVTIDVDDDEPMRDIAPLRARVARLKQTRH